jgi:hypothetical protein
LYAGAGKTNGTAVVAGDVARNAINAIVGSVARRINAAYTAADSATGTGMTYTTKSDGVGMSANRILGGLSIWGEYGSSDFENTQGFTNIQSDTTRYDGDANSWSFGIDKNFGKMLIGLVVSNYDADLKTTFNDGTYDQDIETYGVYIAYRTRILTLDIGLGTGSSDIDTSRRDLGSDLNITGSTKADVNYQSARVQANFTKGRFSLTPRLSHKNIEVDIDAFTETVPASATGSAIFTASNETLASASVSVSGRTVSSTLSEVGVNISGNWGRIVPYLDVAYQSESSSAGSFVTETSADSNTELSPSTTNGSWVVGGGLNFALGSRLSGGINIGTVQGRNDYEESFASGGLSFKF